MFHFGGYNKEVGLHHPSRYTIYGTQIVDQLIQRDLRHVVQSIRARWPDGLLSAIVLTGGYGRGEGGVLRKNSQEFPCDAYAVQVVFQTLKPSEKARINQSLTHLSQELSSKTAAPVVIAPACDLQGLQQMPFTLEGYLLRHSHRLLWGQLDLLQVLPDYPSDQMPAQAGFQLLLQRGMVLWQAITAGYPLLDPWKDPRWPVLLSALHQAICAIGDAFLWLRGDFHPVFAERVKRLKEHLRHEPDWPDATLLAYLYPEAIQYQLSPSDYRNLPIELVVGKLEVVRKLYLAYYLRFLALHLDWEHNRISDFHAWVEHLRSHPPALISRFRHLADNRRRFGSQMPWNGWIWHDPDWRFMVSLPYLLAPEEFPPGPEWEGLFPHLTATSSQGDLAEQVLAFWQNSP